RLPKNIFAGSINGLRLAVLGVSEFFGTTVLLFLSCTGCTSGAQGPIRVLHTSMAAGLAVTVVIQMLGHISGAHVNPVVTLSAFILDELSCTEVLVYIFSQLLGSLAGSGFHELVTSSELYVGGDTTEAAGNCVNLPDGSLTDWQALGVEIILSVILVIANCACWDQRNNNKVDSVPLKIGMVVVALNLSAGVYTGASMNPARSFGPAVWANNFDSHWVYWVGPTIGSLIASYFYKYTFSKVR
ncbi:unnamed protein product, partial [Phaedon cochleariae]